MTDHQVTDTTPAEPVDEPWPPPTVEGKWVPLPGLFDEAPERPAEGRYPS